ncbi:RNA polymerase sigma factor [Actinocatenispora thailandica]|uniref:RNA polymerase sigma factor n=1 Tax=Actinocatenispora thailandica TaxID=227318 RepID=A0A7R7DLT5_9ACTN|nr:sigma-70 family RNA polymerase sigma factor [Actinocatenispora thailandica]BCJ33957.1 RNA polymerase sigma factor [Actinocatenispora thailandica]
MISAGDAGDSPDPLPSQFRDGADGALRAVFDRYGPAVWRLARSVLPTATDAEDVLQATFVSAWQARESYDPARGSLLTWLLAIARRRSIDQLRARRRHERVMTVEAALSPSDAGRADGVDGIVDRLVMADEIRQLPPEQQRLVHLAFFDDLSHQQIAQRTGLPLGTVKSRLRRAMSRLKDRWEVSRVPPQQRQADTHRLG